MSVFDARLALRVSGEVSRRLRVAAALDQSRLGAFLDRFLDERLPTDEELAEDVRQPARPR